MLSAATTSGWVLLTNGPAAADAYTDLRDRWVDIITGRPDIDESRPEFQTALASLEREMWTVSAARPDQSSGRTKVFTDKPLSQTTNSSHVTKTYSRLRQMAVAWAMPASAYHQSTSLRGASRAWRAISARSAGIGAEYGNVGRYACRDRPPVERGGVVADHNDFTGVHPPSLGTRPTVGNPMVPAPRG